MCDLDLRMNCGNLTTWRGSKIVVPTMATRWHALVQSLLFYLPHAWPWPRSFPRWLLYPRPLLTYATEKKVKKKKMTYQMQCKKTKQKLKKKKLSWQTKPWNFVEHSNEDNIWILIQVSIKFDKSLNFFFTKKMCLKLSLEVCSGCNMLN